MKNRHSNLIGLALAAALVAFVVPTQAFGQTPIVLGDDDFEEVTLPFTFSYCGFDFDSVFVGSNGYLTFAQGDTDFSESSGEMLSQEPRIALLWDDLNPTAGGTVDYVATQTTFTVNYTDIPEFFSTGANTFSVTLKKSSDQVEINYGDLTATDGLAGLSCGGGFTTGLEVGSDLTLLAAEAGNSAINARNSAALFEQFSFGTNDLANVDLRFSAPNAFNDTAEQNNDLQHATPVQLPFSSGLQRGNSGNIYTWIFPVGADVDFFRFSANAGQIVIAETNGGAVFPDTFIGLFDVATGTLVDSDDDGGDGLFSRLVTVIPADGTYAIGVTTFPDFDFSGDGSSGGRYLLDIELSDELPLFLSDDGFEEVALPCSFPFQGSSYNSVWVNANGSLTFGSGDSDFSESQAEMLSQEPRIAMLWDDLNPTAGGSISVGFGADSATVNFVDVPEFISTGANTFSATLTCSTGDISMTWGTTNGSDGISGVSPGGNLAADGPVDLSGAASWSISPAPKAVYEVFGFGSFDLDNSTVDFNP